MDIRCPKCAESWDVDSIHDEADYRGETFDAVRREFFANGCVALGGSPCQQTGAGFLAGELADIRGDDIDGLASILKDADLMGMFD